ncbi:MAG TPA: lysophospholipid acyltransferase family protein [Ktedonobacterales bacterium]
MKYWLFRTLAFVVPLVPYWLLQRIAYPAGWIFWACAPALRERGDWNLAHVPTLKDDPVARRKAVRGVFVHLVWNYIDFLRGRRLSNEQILRGWDITGMDKLEAVMANGHGCVLFSGHFGPFELGMSRLGALGYPVKVTAERLKPESVFQLVVKLREHHGFRFLPADAKSSVIEIRRALERNEIIGFAVDRFVAGTTTARLPLFGVPATFSIGPAAIAISMGAPMGVAFNWREGFDLFKGDILPLDFHLDEGETVDKGATRVQKIFLQHMERHITAHPEQWVSALSRVWKRDETMTITEKQVANG